MKLNYFLIPLFTIVVALAGSAVTSAGMMWYRTIKLPSWTPPGSVIGAVWTTIFVLATIAALIYWNQAGHGPKFWLVILFFVLNGLLNFFWSYLFFSQHLLGLAVGEAVLLGLSVVILMILIWPVSRAAALLLLPYAGWVGFASYLTYAVWRLN